MADQADEIGHFQVNFLPYIALNFLMIWLGLFPSVLLGYWFFTTFPFNFSPLYLVSLVGLGIAMFGVALLSTIFFTKVGFWIVNKRIAYLKVGTYPLTMKEPQVRAFVMKGNIANFGRWLYAFFHIQFLRAFWLRRLGVKIGKNVKLGRFFTEEENIEIGDGSFFAWETLVAAHLMYQDKVSFYPVKVGKNCIFKGHGGIAGGTVGDNSIVGHITGVMQGQIGRGNAIYDGVPAKKVADNDLSPKEIQALKDEIQEYDNINWIKRKNAPIKVSEVKMFLLKLAIVLGGCLFASLTPFLYYLFFRAYYAPANHLVNILILTPIPLVFIISIGFFIVGTTIFTKLFIVYYDRKGEIPEGTYELDDPRAKWFKIKYFLRLFGLRLFRGTPFKVADSLAIRFWGNVKFGKNAWMDEANIDPQYLEVGDYSHIGERARIHTHDIYDDKLYIKSVKIGKNVLIGGYAHIRPGVEIADGSVVAVAAWFRKNRKCKRPALWMGKPAFELPLEVFKRSAKFKERYID